MAPKGVKASKVYKRGLKPKIIDWVTQETSRGARDIAVEVSTLAGQRTKKQAARGIENLNAASASHQAALPSMDIDETFWTEEPVADEMKRNNYTEDFIPMVDSYLHCLLNYEGVPTTTMCAHCKSAPFEWRCSNCFPAPVLCWECCRDSYQWIQKWTGKYFMPSWLQEIGVNLHLGHSGDMDCDEEASCQAGSCEKDDVTANFNFGSSKPDCHNKDGKPFITVINRSGIHEIGINWCCCPEAPKHDSQLMMAGLFPATFHNPKTAFTFWVLEEFHLDNLKCKTTPSQFFSRLKRLTSEEFPNTVPVGVFIVSANGSILGASKGQLILEGTYFLQEIWFQAEHMRMRNPENDVPLSDGTGFMVSQMPYELHLKSAVDWQQRSTCHDHHAVNHVNKHSAHLESTGIGAIACIHGNFVPDSIVDFQKGEVQKNMDYSIFKAINYNMDGIEAALICYDVMCQWSVHMKDRVIGSSFLNLPDNLELRLGIVNALSTRYRKALSGAIASFAAFESINASANPAHVATWTAEEMLAQQKQADDVTAMDIYDIKLKRSLARKIGTHPTPYQQRDITLRCAQLQEKIDTFQKQAANFIHAAANGGYDSCEDTSAREVYIGSKFDGIDKENDDDKGITSPSASHQMQLSENGSTDSSVDAEYILLHLPANLG
ncbi:hypothetical protein EI94DRAFT_1696667 [Lactarius quietus]|nr:hypothetical protein EI94DRAFT_1696667 [Lactarius quietus]